MKLVIQIPCLNEAEQLPATLADLPRSVPGFDEVEVLVIDDGSTDATAEVAMAHGVDHLVRFPRNRGLAEAFQAGLDAALHAGADVIVNTDADNQYRGDSIPDLVVPIVEGRADVVVGDRDVRNHEEFSWIKRRLQVLGSWVVAQASGTKVPDATSGFRAYTREAALRLVVVNQYTYTIESLIQAGRSRLAVEHVPVRVNPKTRPSRLFGSSLTYVRRNAVVITRVFAAYQPLRFFGTLAVLLFLGGLGAFVPFLSDWILNGDRSGHLQSLLLGTLLVMAGVQSLVVAVVADLVASNRDVSHRILTRTRLVELEAGIGSLHVDRPFLPTPARGDPPDGSGPDPQ